jgi:hypothetical protein
MNYSRVHPLAKAATYIKTPSFSQSIIVIDGVELSLPAKPKKELFVNYGLPVSQQKFVKLQEPEDILSWDIDELEEYIRIDWHLRLNGYWILIKGKEFYIPQGCHVFFNYWETEQGKTPKFRIEALNFFQVWYLGVEDDPNVLGLIDIKCRRLGDTEKALFINWERTTRFKFMRSGMQHLNEKDCEKAFSRMNKGSLAVPFWFRPKRKGFDSASEIEYAKPGEAETVKKHERGILSSKEIYLNSVLTMEASKTGKYDGQLLHFYHMDEAFKHEQHRMNVVAQLNNINQCCTLDNTRFVGKIIVTSTVEEMESGRMVEVARGLWEESNPDQKNELGHTQSKYIRVFRDYKYNSPVDAYGFHLTEEITRRRELALKEAKERDDWTRVMDIYRKQPSSIEEALMIPRGEAVLHPDLCDKRIMQINNGENWVGESGEQRLTVGNLVWTKGFGSDVKFLPMRGGRWNFTLHPGHYANNIKTMGKTVKPLNRHMFRIGVDPFDAPETQEKGSAGALAVRALYIPEFETKDILFDPDGNIINAWDLITDQFICDYTYRPDNPYEFYEDVLKTCIYYGTSAQIERDKPGLIAYLKQKGYDGLADKQVVLDNKTKKNLLTGTKATMEMVDSYVEALSIHVFSRISCTQLPRLVRDWRSFTKKLRTRHDLAVASGWGELALGKQLHGQGRSYRDDWENASFL